MATGSKSAGSRSDIGTRQSQPKVPNGGYGVALKRRPWILLAPTLLILGLLLGYPLARMAWFSFQNYGLRELNTGEANFTGFENYQHIFGDSYLYTVVLPNTVGFAALCVFLTIVLGTLVALFLKGLPTFWRYLTSTAVMVAWAVPAVTGTYVWRFIFEPSNGLATNFLGKLGVIEPGSVNWFIDRLSFYAIATLNVVHHSIPFVAVTVLAALLTIPEELYEAARIDGANRWRQFWTITVPVLKPVFAVVTILSTIWDFKVFTQIYLMPGGDGSNEEIFNLGLWAYSESFAQGKYGMGSAIAVVLTGVLLLITIVYLRTLFKEDEL